MRNASPNQAAASTVADSQVSGATYISQLEDELNNERVARQRLQDDIQNLKKMNEEISAKLGITTN